MSHQPSGNLPDLTLRRSNSWTSIEYVAGHRSSRYCLSLKQQSGPGPSDFVTLPIEGLSEGKDTKSNLVSFILKYSNEARETKLNAYKNIIIVENPKGTFRLQDGEVANRFRSTELLNVETEGSPTRRSSTGRSPAGGSSTPSNYRLGVYCTARDLYLVPQKKEGTNKIIELAELRVPEEKIRKDLRWLIMNYAGRDAREKGNTLAEVHVIEYPTGNFQLANSHQVSKLCDLEIARQLQSVGSGNTRGVTALRAGSMARGRQKQPTTHEHLNNAAYPHPQTGDGAYGYGSRGYRNLAKEPHRERRQRSRSPQGPRVEYYYRSPDHGGATDRYRDRDRDYRDRSPHPSTYSTYEHRRRR